MYHFFFHCYKSWASEVSKRSRINYSPSSTNAIVENSIHPNEFIQNNADNMSQKPNSLLSE